MKYWKIVLVVIVFASLMVPGTSLARVHNATGSVKFSDSDPSFSTNLSDRLTVKISNIFAFPGKNYYAWLSSDDQISFLALGIIELDGSGGGTLTYTSPTGENLIDGYNGFWVSSEAANSVGTKPESGTIVMSDVIVPGSMAHIRHVMSAWTPSADGKGLAVGSREQTDKALTHANLSVNSASLADVQAHAHHVINIVEGSSGDNYDADFGDPGDGFGVLTYAADAGKHSGFAAGADGVSDSVALHSVHVEDTSTNVVNWATQARDKALDALDTDDVATAKTAITEAQGLLDWALNGKDGSNAPVIDGGGARTAYQHGQLMAGYSPVFDRTVPSGLGTTWNVIAGGIVPEEKLAMNVFFPNDITVVEGDTISFQTRGFHTVSLLSGAEPPDLDPAPLPDGRLALNAQVAVPSGPPQVEYDGTGFVNSGLPQPPPGGTPPGGPPPGGPPPGGGPPPFKITFTKAGTYEVVCLTHLAMKASVTVLPADSSAPMSQADLDAAADAKFEELLAQGEALKATAELVVTDLAGGARDYMVTAGLAKDDIGMDRFFPDDLTVFAGDTVTWDTAGTEVPTVIMFTSGAPVPDFMVIEERQGAPPLIFITPALLPPQGGNTYSGTGVVSSGILLGAAGPPGAPTTFTLKFDTPGSYNYSSPFGLPFQVGRINVLAAPIPPSVGDARVPPLMGSLAGLLGIILVLGGGYLVRRRLRP